MIDISVIIPVYNSPGGLAATLQALAGQEDISAGQHEIIVVDNNSTDDTSTVAENYAENRPGVVKVVHEPVQGSYVARNRGIKEAEGEILCFLDADVIPEKRYLSRIRDVFSDGGIDYAGANVTLKRSGGFFGDYDAVTAFPVQVNLEQSLFSPTCCLTVRRKVIAEVGTFDARLESGGDLELGKRVEEAGYRQKFLRDITVVHPVRNSFAALAAKKRRVARGNAELVRFHPERFGYKMFEHSLGRVLLPHKPGTLQRVSRERSYDFSLGYCMLLALLSIPLNYIGYRAYNREYDRLQDTGDL